MKRSSAEMSEGGEKEAQKEARARGEAELLQDAMQKVDVPGLLAQDGPEVQCVLLRGGEGGGREEVRVNMSPKLRKTQEVLGGAATFLGQWEDLQVILMINPDEDDKQNPKVLNSHKLQPPFHNAEVYGDILLTRSDDDGLPKDFTMKEYDDFCKLEIKEWEPEIDEEEDFEEGSEEEDGESEEEEEFDEEDDEDDEEGDEDADTLAVLDILKARLIAGYEKEYGREPTAEELEELMASLTGKLDALHEGDEEEEEEEESKAEGKN